MSQDDSRQVTPEMLEKTGQIAKAEANLLAKADAYIKAHPTPDKPIQMTRIPAQSKPEVAPKAPVQPKPMSTLAALTLHPGRRSYPVGKFQLITDAHPVSETGDFAIALGAYTPSLAKYTFRAAEVDSPYLQLDVLKAALEAFKKAVAELEAALPAAEHKCRIKDAETASKFPVKNPSGPQPAGANKP
jgi:hypothetical protein